jgi:hypothetical protein
VPLNGGGEVQEAVSAETAARMSGASVSIFAPIIPEQDWRNPVTASNRSGLIVRGHGRQDTALLISRAAIPVHEPDHTGKAHSELDFHFASDR